jgi:hypothetical protein
VSPEILGIELIDVGTNCLTLDVRWVGNVNKERDWMGNNIRLGWKSDQEL